MTANRFVWHELVTSTIDMALSFYGKLLGWETQEVRGGALIVQAKDPQGAMFALVGPAK